MIDDKLNFTDHITKTARSCRFALYNIKKIRSFLWEHATQLLVQALVLSTLDYCNALLAGLTASPIKPLQLIQNAAARLIFNEPKRTHVLHLFIKFALATNICSKFTSSDVCASRSLCSTSERRITVPSQRCTKSLPQTFSLTVPTWNDLPNSIRAILNP